MGTSSTKKNKKTAVVKELQSSTTTTQKNGMPSSEDENTKCDECSDIGCDMCFMGLTKLQEKGSKKRKAYSRAYAKGNDAFVPFVRKVLIKTIKKDTTTRVNNLTPVWNYTIAHGGAKKPTRPPVKKVDKKPKKVTGKPKNEKKKKKKKDPNLPKMGKTAFLFYSTEQRPKIRDEDRTLSFGDISKKISVGWKALTKEEKAVYEEMSKEDKARQNALRVEYLSSLQHQDEEEEEDQVSGGISSSSE